MSRLYLAKNNSEDTNRIIILSIESDMSYELVNRRRVSSAKMHPAIPGRGHSGKRLSLNQEGNSALYLGKGGSQPMRIQSANPRREAHLTLGDQQRVQQSRSIQQRAQEHMTEEIISLKLTIKGLM